MPASRSAYPATSNADQGTAIAVQTDGKIVAVGGSEATPGGAHDFAIERFDSNGHLDHSFSGDGLVFTPITVSTPTSQALALAVAIQRDGKIVVAGKAYNGTDYDIAVVRYNANGSLDSTFAGDGIATLGIGAHDDQATAVAVQRDGKIVVGGDFDNGLNYDMSVVRYNANGSLDSTFDGDGIATTTPVLGLFPDYTTAMVIQRDGKIVLAGYALFTNADTILVRFDANGHRDGSFDSDGVRDDDFSGVADGANSLVVLSDGTLLEGGFDGPSMNLAWYGSDGLPIKSTVPTYAGSPINGAAGKVAVQTDGKLVVLASVVSSETVYRLLPDGTSDTSFANGGRFTSTADAARWSGPATGSQDRRRGNRPGQQSPALSRRADREQRRCAVGARWGARDGERVERDGVVGRAREQRVADHLVSGRHVGRGADYDDERFAVTRDLHRARRRAPHVQSSRPERSRLGRVVGTVEHRDHCRALRILDARHRRPRVPVRQRGRVRQPAGPGDRDRAPP